MDDAKSKKKKKKNLGGEKMTKKCILHFYILISTII